VVVPTFGVTLSPPSARPDVSIAPSRDQTGVRVVWLLAVAGLVAYALRTDIAIAQEQLAPALMLSLAQMGVISGWGFQFAYTVFQVPAGVLADRYGVRLVLGMAIIGWSIASLASGVVTGPGAVAFALLFAARVLQGATQAAMFPAAALAATQFVSESRRVAASGLYLASSSLGAALAPLLLTPVMARDGWRAVFHTSAACGAIMAIVWFALAPSRPVLVRSTTRPTVGQQLREAARLLRQPAFQLLLTAYLLHSAIFFVFVFWFFRYLVEARGFSLLDSGVWSAVPHLTTFVVVPIVGMLTDRMGQRSTPSGARRRVAIVSIAIAACLVQIGALLPSAYLAIAAVSLAVACMVSCEAPFWTTTSTLAPSSAGAAGGVLNLAGNLGGVLSIWLVPLMKDAWGWSLMLSFWAALALVTAALWYATGRAMQGIRS
jgi:MFS transporter, ACS family, glucarate transporter